MRMSEFVVRDAASEHTQAFQLCPMTELLLHFAPLGNVCVDFEKADGLPPAILTQRPAADHAQGRSVPPRVL